MSMRGGESEDGNCLWEVVRRLSGTSGCWTWLVAALPVHAQSLERTAHWQAHLIAIIETWNPAPPGSHNGWCDVLDACDALGLIKQGLFEQRSPAGLHAIDPEWIFTDDDCADGPLGNLSRFRQQLLGLVQGHGVVSSLRRADEAGHWWMRPTVPSRAESLGLPGHISPLHLIVRIAAGSIEDGARVGQWDTVAEWFRLALMTVIASESNGGLVAGIMGNAGRSVACDRLRPAVVGHRPPAPALRAMLDALDRYAERPPIEFHFRAEEVIIQDTIDGLYAPDGTLLPAALIRVLYVKQRFPGLLTLLNDDSIEDAAPHPIAQHVEEWMTYDRVNALGFLCQNRAVAAAEIEGLIGAATEGLSGSPRSDAVQRAAQAYLDGLPPSSAAVRALVGNLPNALAEFIGDRIQVEAMQAATHLLLALELHRAERGSYPDSLDALVPHALAGLPRDPFAPDGRFRYRRLAAPDEHGREYLLYSVGFDGLDNAGSPPASGAMHEAFLVEGAGSDWIANPPRPR